MDMSGTGRLATDVTNARGTRIAFAAAVLFALLCIWVNPVGYVGGGGDDEQYLSAARCWVASGLPCLPHSHWWTRWPAFAPVALTTVLFGESRATVGIGPLLFWALALAALGFTTARWFGGKAGALAVALLAATPVFTALALSLSTDVPELAFQLCALAAATVAFERQDWRWAVTGGLFAGLALQARDTSLIFAGVAALAWLTLERKRRRVLLWAIAGFAAVLVVEAVGYGLMAGDPLLRWKLALHHVRIPSNALPAGFDTSQSPLFNPAYIRAWSREAGVKLWWPIDPWLNLLATPRFLALPWAAAIATLAFRRCLPARQRRSALRLALAAALVALLLVYGLAIDPKSRMFLPAAAALSAITAAMLVAGWRRGSRALALLLAALPLGYGITVLSHYSASGVAERRASEWLASDADRIEIDPAARSYLTLLPAARALPARGAGRPMVILLSAGGCGLLIGPERNARVVDQVGGPDPSQGRLCLIAYGSGPSGPIPARK
jgi:4-amino-4-deoxy-L-arabinose transferase-like glycosyltransferase